MSYIVDDYVELKDKHPCKYNLWKIIKVGVDVKVKCLSCGKVLSFNVRNFNEHVQKFISCESKFTFLRHMKKGKVVKLNPLKTCKNCKKNKKIGGL